MSSPAPIAAHSNCGASSPPPCPLSSERADAATPHQTTYDAIEIRSVPSSSSSQSQKSLAEPPDSSCGDRHHNNMKAPNGAGCNPLAEALKEVSSSGRQSLSATDPASPEAPTENTAFPLPPRNEITKAHRPRRYLQTNRFPTHRTYLKPRLPSPPTPARWRFVGYEDRFTAERHHQSHVFAPPSMQAVQAPLVGEPEVYIANVWCPHSTEALGYEFGAGVYVGRTHYIGGHLRGSW
ncbi:hypothetical protein FGB62_42g14 [Gracilaria domingensis]|nr:hypothetical protein FGB62_42g14 [Gracilaria domingensis]